MRIFCVCFSVIERQRVWGQNLTRRAERDGPSGSLTAAADFLSGFGWSHTKSGDRRQTPSPCSSRCRLGRRWGAPRLLGLVICAYLLAATAVRPSASAASAIQRGACCTVHTSQWSRHRQQPPHPAAPTLPSFFARAAPSHTLRVLTAVARGCAYLAYLPVLLASLAVLMFCP